MPRYRIEVTVEATANKKLIVKCIKKQKLHFHTHHILRAIHWNQNKIRAQFFFRVLCVSVLQFNVQRTRKKNRFSSVNLLLVAAAVCFVCCYDYCQEIIVLVWVYVAGFAFVIVCYKVRLFVHGVYEGKKKRIFDYIAQLIRARNKMHIVEKNGTGTATRRREGEEENVRKLWIKRYNKME